MWGKFQIRNEYMQTKQVWLAHDVGIWFPAGPDHRNPRHLNPYINKYTGPHKYPPNNYKPTTTATWTRHTQLNVQTKSHVQPLHSTPHKVTRKHARRPTKSRVSTPDARRSDVGRIGAKSLLAWFIRFGNCYFTSLLFMCGIFINTISIDKLFPVNFEDIRIWHTRSWAT